MSGDPIVSFDRVDIVFGSRPQSALALMDQGLSREEIKERTGQVLGVHNCSLDVAEGEIVVLMGLSGSGKSTLLRGVNGLNKIVRGRIVVMDEGGRRIDVAKADAATLRRLRTTRTAMVFQQVALLPWRSVLENVAFGLELAGVNGAERRERAMRQLDLVNLKDWSHCRIEELSGGMQQRVGLARAFATDAPILLMDEPFSALDPLIRHRLQSELIELQKNLRRTIIFVSHDLDEALRIGNRIAIMEGGRIVQCGSPHDIVLNPANDYVADFVAHMNPLNVLRAAEVMEANDPVPAPADARMLNPDDIPQGQVYASPQTPIGVLMQALLQRHDSIGVIDDGQIVGKVGRDEVMRALLRVH